jgi:hypothetical protein
MITLPIRIALIFVTACCFLYGLPWLGFILLVFLSVQFAAYEYIALAFCIDCYFSPEPILFWYTGIVTIVVIGGIVLQPFIRRNDRVRS